jgi:hypothetical protein
VDNEARPAADALVLTEWKVVRGETERESKAEQAYEQARLYASGSLAGFELSSRRYLVLVSDKWPRRYRRPPRSDGNVVYEHIYVEVSPAQPSTQSRQSV